MPTRQQHCSRRDFLRVAGKAGIGTLAVSLGSQVHANQIDKSASPEATQVPTRSFGKTGIRVSALAMGGSQNLLSKQLLLQQALKCGITYWDTAYIYAGGKSEEGIGKYFSKFPEDRQRVFLVSKSPSANPAKMSRYLRTSLERLKTDYIDLYLIHKLSNLNAIDHQGVKEWADKAKAKGLIRLFGFSTHKNMVNCLLQGAALGWIDGIMTSYNYRLMQSGAMQTAVEACYKAGIGLTAMKTQAPFLANLYAEIGQEDDKALSLTEQFMQKGYTPHQAKLKIVWENPFIASICSEMPNMTILQANVAAAGNPRRLSNSDKRLLREYAKDTSHGYCTSCADKCESVVESSVPISDIIRCLMYHYNYENLEKAKSAFQRLPEVDGRSLTQIDYSEAERRCPHHMPIALLMRGAAELFA